LTELLNIIYDLIITLVIVVSTWIATRFLIRGFIKGVEKSGSKSVPVERFRELISLLGVAVAVALIIDFSGVGDDFLGGLTLSGMIVLVVTLSLQTTLSNVISGLILFYDGLVREGDYVQIEGTKGRVVRITLRACFIEADDENLVVISNQKILWGPIINISRKKELLSKAKKNEMPAIM